MRYLPLTDSDRREMLNAIGVSDIEALFADVPAAARLTAPLDLPPHQGEQAVEKIFSGFARQNLGASSVPSFLGGGAYRHHVPASVDYLIQRGEFLTSYTPYQPEISQGTLQYLFEFQTQVAMLTGMEVANASLYDGASACAEAVVMAHRITRRTKAVLSGNLHPHYRAAVETHGRFAGFQCSALPPRPGAADEDLAALIDNETSCLVVQYPDFFGSPRDLRPLADACHAKGALLVVVVTEIVALGALCPPGEMGADIVCGEGQSLGNGLNFGGPYLGLFATSQRYLRQMPGRLCGETVDADGRRGYVLTLSTREQHIRREKATSNICTNSGLCALAFTIHLTLLGEQGLRHLAMLNHRRARKCAERLSALPGVEILNQRYFNEFTLRLPVAAAPVVERMASARLLGGVPVSRLFPKRAEVENLLLVAVTETVGDDDIEFLANELAAAL